MLFRVWVEPNFEKMSTDGAEKDPFQSYIWRRILGSDREWYAQLCPAEMLSSRLVTVMSFLMNPWQM